MMVCRHSEVVKLCTRIKATYAQLCPPVTPSRASITVQALHVMNLVALSRCTEAEPLARECLAQVAQLPGEARQVFVGKLRRGLPPRCAALCSLAPWSAAA
jgi:hypothetical protein